MYNMWIFQLFSGVYLGYFGRFLVDVSIFSCIFHEMGKDVHMWVSGYGKRSFYAPTIFTFESQRRLAHSQS